MTENKTEQKSARKVLIAMDGSKHALFAFESTVLLASPVAVANIVEQHEEAVLKVFKKLDEIANRYKIKHTLERIERPHRPGEAIVKAAHQQNIDLIITGTRGLGTIRRTILGSVSDYIIHHARVPVIVCKHGDHI
ncbi:putative universal stress protein SAUSA300_1656 isoform X3 [Ruditapes philippinarum]|uniref:putative universal stress protein SAUSA300_1656 isoform X3 n=1 Tax=Ruditapes philippinarum TaxID=129788 RepID=UPI00295AAA11|nr:putative universal stress protein SAUSA300_1656 isoform X3 [Ruditapes philippinarum]